MVLHHWRCPACDSLSSVYDSFNLNDYDPGKCSMMEGKPCNSCVELARLDEDIARTHDRFITLIKKRQIVKAKINRRHDPLIQHLPLEIIGQIFTRCVEGINLPFLEDKAEFSKSQCSAPLILAAVCRSWREIAFSTPRIWKTANIYLYSRDQVPLQETLVKEWLARSGELPLAISIYQPVDQESDSQIVDYSFLSPLFDVVRDCAHRWKRLALRIPSSCYATFVGGLTCAPILESLQLFCWLDDGHQKFDLPETPVLTDLRMTNIFLGMVNVQWTNLTVIEMIIINTEEIFEVLRRAPSVEKCIFAEIHPERGSYPLPTTPLTYSLKYLKLGPVEQDDPGLYDFRFVLDHLVLPQLDHFVYDTSDSSTVPVDNLISLFTRSQCDIKTLKIQGPGDSISDDELIRILDHLPSLNRLFLTSTAARAYPRSWITNHLFGRFQISARSSAPENDFLPYLEDLEISSDSPRIFSWGCFLTSITLLQSTILNRRLIGNPQAHVPSNAITASKNLPIPMPLRTHISVTFKLCRNGFDLDYIDPGVVLPLANFRWENGESVRILDKIDGTDLIEASLLRHGFAGHEMGY